MKCKFELGCDGQLVSGHSKYLRARPFHSGGAHLHQRRGERERALHVTIKRGLILATPEGVVN